MLTAECSEGICGFLLHLGGTHSLLSGFAFVALSDTLFLFHAYRPVIPYQEAGPVARRELLRTPDNHSVSSLVNKGMCIWSAGTLESG